MKKEGNLIVDKTFDFSLSIITLYKNLISNNEYIISKQILRSGTSIGANVEEAIGGHSKKDFVAKLTISYKEARETRYWLKLLDKSKMVDLDYSKCLAEIEQIINILTAIIKTSKENNS